MSKVMALLGLLYASLSVDVNSQNIEYPAV